MLSPLVLLNVTSLYFILLAFTTKRRIKERECVCVCVCSALPDGRGGPVGGRGGRIGRTVGGRGGCPRCCRSQSCGLAGYGLLTFILPGPLSWRELFGACLNPGFHIVTKTAKGNWKEQGEKERKEKGRIEGNSMAATQLAL